MYDTFKQREVLLNTDFRVTINTIFCQQNVTLAFKQLKLGKAAGLNTISAEMLTNADIILCHKLADLFTASCKHGFVPNNIVEDALALYP